MSRAARRKTESVESVAKLRNALLTWYDSHARDLPWRVRPNKSGIVAEPYRVWLSEIMLQQTTVAAVKPYFERFLHLFPRVEDMASAPREVVLEAWAGLGYYSRARNLHAAAIAMAERGVPTTEEGWRALPGVGPYTAAAISAIAQGRATNVVDGNVERVMARLHAVETPLPDAKPELKSIAALHVSDDRPGDWAQALMDLGATICTPKSPACALCPVREWCAAFATGAPETFPRRAAKAVKPHRHGIAFRVLRDGKFWFVRRPDKGLLGGMAGLPTTPWRADAWSADEAFAHAPLRANWREVGAIAHTFTHFALTLVVFEAETNANPEGEGWWAADIAPLPNVFRKAALVAS